MATSKPTTILSIAVTLESYAHCSKYLARLSARNFVGARQSGEITFQLYRFQCSRAADINSNVFDFCFLIWSLSRLLCCVVSGSQACLVCRLAHYGSHKVYKAIPNPNKRRICQHSENTDRLNLIRRIPRLENLDYVTKTQQTTCNTTNTYLRTPWS
jgi:hypothetical protein